MTTWHGEPQSAHGDEVCRRTRAASVVDDPGGRDDVAHYGLESIHAALDAAADHLA